MDSKESKNTGISGSQKTLIIITLVVVLGGLTYALGSSSIGEITPGTVIQTVYESAPAQTVTQTVTQTVKELGEIVTKTVGTGTTVTKTQAGEGQTKVITVTGAVTTVKREIITITENVAVKEKETNPSRNIEKVPYWDGDACTMPNHSIHLTSSGSVYYRSTTPIAGFQFDVEGASVTGVSGGDAGAAGFTMSTGNDRVIGFSFELATVTGCGTLVVLDLSGTPTGLSGIVMANSSGEAIPFSQVVE